VVNGRGWKQLLTGCLKALVITAYKICYVNLPPWKNVHNSLGLSYDPFKHQSPLPS
jgi:hypothetical protein